MNFGLKILVPADLTDATLPALQYAMFYARRFKAEVVLLHVIEGGGYAGLAHFLWLRDASRKMKLVQLRLDRWCQDHADPDINVSTLVRFGQSPDQEIAAVVKEHGVRLVILSAGANFNCRRHLGVVSGMTERLIRQVPCSVLIVPSSETVADPFAVPDGLPVQEASTIETLSM